MGTSRWDRWQRSAGDALKSLRHKDATSQMIRLGLTAARERSGEPRRVDLEGLKLVIFSDHHRGTGKDDADDFRRCQRAYRAALGHYFEHGYTLALLGDVEELWENRIAKALGCYEEVLALESEFHAYSRLWRFYGNHDLVWSSPGAVQKHLAQRIGGDPIEVRESLALDLVDGKHVVGRLFLVHGHQGTPSSDLFAPLAMLPVRYVWPRIQRNVKFASTSPAIDWDLREKHDETMYGWALEQAHERPEKEPPLVLIAGHTHKPVFRGREAEDPAKRTGGRPTEYAARAAYDAAVAAGAPADERAAAHAMLEFVRTKPFGPDPLPMEVPCYFNSGCCSYADGDITGLQIAEGNIRLVRWLDDTGEPRCRPLSEAVELRTLFTEVGAVRGG